MTWVIIRAVPSSADINRVASVARQTVLDIAKMDGALGHDAIALLYVQRIWGAIVQGAEPHDPPESRRAPP